MNLKRAIFIAGLLLLAVVTSIGQTTKITVVDDKTGETLIGANVIIDGTMQGATTDLDGVAVLNGLIPGQIYNIKISYISYQTVVIRDLQIETGKQNDLTVRLRPADLKIE